MEPVWFEASSQLWEENTQPSHAFGIDNLDIRQRAVATLKAWLTSTCSVCGKECHAKVRESGGKDGRTRQIRVWHCCGAPWRISEVMEEYHERWKEFILNYRSPLNVRRARGPYKRVATEPPSPPSIWEIEGPEM